MNTDKRNCANCWWITMRKVDGICMVNPPTPAMLTKGVKPAKKNLAGILLPAEIDQAQFQMYPIITTPAKRLCRHHSHNDPWRET